jgi:hypothetical protein
MNCNRLASFTLTWFAAAALAGCGSAKLAADSRAGAQQPMLADQPSAAPHARLDHAAGTVLPSQRPASLGWGQGAAAVLGAARGASAAGLDSGLLPPLPDDSAVQREASFAYSDSADPGAPAAKSSNTTAGGGVATLGSSARKVAWAYYRIPITGTKTPASLQVSGELTAKANGFKSGVYIGLADYGLGRWVIEPNVYNLTAPATVDFSATGNYHSPGRNLYVLVATFNGDVAQITGVQTSGDDANIAPHASLTGAPRVAYTPAQFSFDASGCTDSDGFIVKYEFDFGDGGGFVDNGTTPTVQHTYSTPGYYICQMRVTDEGGLSSIAKVNLYAVDPASFLPLGWYLARLNAGLGADTMGTADIFGPGHTYPNLYFNGVTDMQTKLPPFFSGWYSDPESFPAAISQESDALQGAGGLQDLLLDADAKYMTNYQIQRQGFNPALDPNKPLSTAIAGFVTAAGGTAQPSVYETAVGSMPLNQQTALAPLFYACSDALARRTAAFSAIGLTDPADIQSFYDSLPGDPLGGVLSVNTGQYNPVVYDVTGGNFLLAGFPYSDAFFTGAAEITDALDKLRTFIQTNNPSWANVSLTVDTPVGRIEISGTGDDTHTAPADGNGHAILIDLGGNDTYNCQAGATASGANGVSLCVDMSGDDTYNRLDDPDDVDRTQNPSNDNTPQQGSGRLGIGILVDYSGTDHYHSVRMSQGSCLFGVGLLADYAGDDSYDMEALGQGGAFAGIAILYDKSGSDSYSGWHKVQGFGGLMGIGMLVDAGTGGDTYVATPDADPAKPEYVLFDTTSHKNTSMAQGAGEGSDFGFLSFGSPAQNEVGGGGYGLLFDGGGSDSYTCGIMGQGVGFFESTGVLIDRGGDDTYNSYEVAQGAAVELGLGCLLDQSGGDHYNCQAGLGAGAADSLALAWLLDLQGDDTYDGTDLGLGCGSANGFGYFVDYAGADHYGGHGTGFQDTTLGRALLNGGADTNPAYGIFVDNGGLDTYATAYSNMANASPDLPGDNKFWVRTVDGTYASGRGSGIDLEP